MDAENAAEEGGRLALVGLLKERSIETAGLCSLLQQCLVIDLDTQFTCKHLCNLLATATRLAANCHYKLFHIKCYLFFPVSTP